MVGSFFQDPFAQYKAGQDHVDYTRFDSRKAFDTMGFADSDGAANGRAGTQEVDGNKLKEEELLREKREKRDKTNELMELGAQLRQSRSESVTVGGISLSIGEWKDIRDTLDDPAKLALVREQMRAEGKTDAEIAESEYHAKMASTIAIKKYQGKELTSEEQVYENKLENDPTAQKHIKDTVEAYKVTVDRRLESDRNASEHQNAHISSISEQPKFIVSRAQTLDDSDRVKDNLTVKEDISIGDSPFADTRNVSDAFNASASGTAFAEAAPRALPETQPSSPTLSNG